MSRHQPHPSTPQTLLITLLFSLVTKRWGGKSFRSAQGKTTKHGRVGEKKTFKDLIFFFSRGKFNRSEKQNNITNTQANTVDASSLVEFVSLIASLVLLLAEAYQRAPFISARIKPLLWLLGTHWGGLEMGRGWRAGVVAGVWGGGASKQRRQGRGSQNWRWWVKGRWRICAFKGKWEKKKVEFGGELPTASAMCLWNKSVRMCVCVCFCSWRRERKRSGERRRGRSLSLGRSCFIYVPGKLICICFKPALPQWFLADVHYNAQNIQVNAGTVKDMTPEETSNTHTHRLPWGHVFLLTTAAVVLSSLTSPLFTKACDSVAFLQDIITLTLPARALPLKGESAWCSLTFRAPCLMGGSWYQGDHDVLLTLCMTCHMCSQISLIAYAFQCDEMIAVARSACKRYLAVDYTDMLVSQERHTVQTI